MAEVEINHAFVSLKADSPDPSLVSASEWNARLNIGGGSNGQTVVRDASQPHGARWTQGVSVQRTTGTYGGGGTSSLSLASMVVTLQTPGTIILFPYVQALTSASQPVTIAIRRNFANLSLPNWFGTGFGGIFWTEVDTQPAGTYTYDMIVSVSTGTITSVTAYLTALILGT